MGDHRDLAAWDAEIETDFQLAMAGARAAGRRKRGQRQVGFPFAFMADVCRLTSRRASLVVAVLIYRRTFVVSNRTVTLPAAELAELGIDRRLKNRALAQLAAARLVRVESDAPGRVAKVTLLWRPSDRGQLAPLPGPGDPPGPSCFFTLSALPLSGGS